MSRHRIEYIYRRSEILDSGIEYIGGRRSDGKIWKISVDRAIEGILSGKWSFYVVRDNKELPVILGEIDNRIKLCLDTTDIDYIELF